MTKLVIGLGNPGSEYERTRHNVGFRVVDKLASKLGWKWTERRNRAVLASGTIGHEKVVLAKPITFMNLSGQAVGELVRWYKIQPEDVIQHLHTTAFPSLRVGIGHPSNTRMSGKDYVLSIPGNDERILLEAGEDRAVDAIQLAITQGIGTTMNLVNADPEEAERKAAERLQRQKERQERARLKREAAQREQETRSVPGSDDDFS